ncbi:hypothetical protein LWI29_021611 [Acer saccharum]|uniref:Uncharacterized protein n=1 Tax=Acer saccharum TaxID=4024 RepID=A0AA39RXM2_ACESA|nr:hypothetical protein LWI29_021611 [Acer saccharum]
MSFYLQIGWLGLRGKRMDAIGYYAANVENWTEQDNEYVTPMLADKEKEVIALKQAESLRLKEDEYWKKLLEIKKIKNVR